MPRRFIFSLFLSALLVALPHTVPAETLTTPPRSAPAQDTRWREYSAAALKAWNQRNYAEAEKMSLAALKEAETFGPQDTRVAITLHGLGGLYRDMKKYAEAEALYHRALAIYEKAGSAGDRGVVQVLDSLAANYSSQGKDTEAEAHYRRALAIYEKTQQPDYLTSAYNNLAVLYKKRGNYTEAEKLFQRSLAAAEKIVGPDHPTVAFSLLNLADFYAERGKFTEAEPRYRRSLTIFEKSGGPNDPRVPMVLEKYADLLRKTNRKEEAAKLEERAHAILGSRP